MKTETRKCRVCRRLMSVYPVRMMKGTSLGSRFESDDGVCFKYGWFCNDCWKLILREIDLPSLTKEIRKKLNG